MCERERVRVYLVKGPSPRLVLGQARVLLCEQDRLHRLPIGHVGLFPSALQAETQVVVLVRGVLAQLIPLIELAAALDPLLLPQIELEQLVRLRDTRLVDVEVKRLGDRLLI